jgi:hypothetical protein
MSYIDEETGTRIFSNCMIEKNMFVDKTTLEDLLEFHKIKFEIIRGYYFNEGHNTGINDVIKYLFEERKKKKKEDNPIQETFKLIMNSAYGKSLMKPILTKIHFKNSKEKM